MHSSWWREREKMEVQAVFGRASPPCLSSSLLSSQTQRTSCSLSYTHCPIQRTKHHLHLAAFHSKSHLFSYSPSRPHAKTLSHKTHIFLPHLVAAMVCFSPSFFSTFYLNYRKPIWKFCTFFLLLSFLVSLCVQEQVEETYIMVKPDAVQRGLVSFTLICLQFLTNLCQIWLLRKHRGKV